MLYQRQSLFLANIKWVKQSQKAIYPLIPYAMYLPQSIHSLWLSDRGFISERLVFQPRNDGKRVAISGTIDRQHGWKK